MLIHIDFGVTDNCKNLMESYGEICVKCNKCGRFDEADEWQKMCEEAEKEKEE